MKRGFTLVEIVVVVAISLILGALLFSVLQRPRYDGRPRSICQSNLKQISLGIKQYLTDNDDYLPLIASKSRGWAESMQPYMKSWPIFQCPSDGNRVPKTSDYFLNARVAGLKRPQIPFGAQTILLGEGTDNGATNSHLSELPLDWKSDENSPAQRHLGGANYAFVDGHVKWFKPEKISAQSPNRKDFVATFAVR